MNNTENNFDISVELIASLDTLNGELARARRRRNELNQLITLARVTGIPIALSGGDGTLQAPTLLGPVGGQWWDVHRITAWGFTAGTVNAYLTSPAGDLILPWTSQGTITLGKAQLPRWAPVLRPSGRG